MQQDTPLRPSSSESALIFERVQGLWQSLVANTPRIAIAATAVLFTWLVARAGSAVLSRSLRRTSMRGSLQALLRQLFYAAAWVIGLLVAANLAFPSVTPGETLTALGVGSIAIGFAFKDIFENFFAGVLILWRFPFENGDFIRCGDILGRVEQTTIRMTLVRQVDGRLLVVPNARLFKDPVEVLTAEDLARTDVIVGIAYREDIETAREVIGAAAQSQPTVAGTPPVDVQVVELDSSSVNFRVLWWTGSDPAARRDSRDQVLTSVKAALDEAGIEIPFPYRTLTFGEGEEERLAVALAHHAHRAGQPAATTGDRDAKAN